jgi:hypothetical protein
MMSTLAPLSSVRLTALIVLVAAAPTLAAAPAPTPPGPATPPATAQPVTWELPPAAAALAARLATDAPTLERAHARPVHRGQPGPGSLGDALARHLPAFERERPILAPSRPAPWLWEVARGRRDAGALEAGQAAAASRLAGPLEALLAGTLAGQADLAVAEDPLRPAPGASWIGYQLAVALAGVRTRQLLEQGDPAAAARTCLDGLALLRDAAIAGGLAGSLVAADGVPELSGACAAAIDAAPVSAQREALAALGAIRAALPPLQEVFRVEGLREELMRYGRLAGPALRTDAGPRVRALIDRGAAPPVAEAARRRQAARWIRTRAAWDRLVHAARTESAGRPAAFAVADRMLLVARGREPAGPSFARHAQRIEATARWLDALSLATASQLYRRERGTWPMDPRALFTWLPAGGAERTAAAVARLEPTLELRSLEIRVPPPPGAPSDEAPVFAIASVR